MQDGLKAVEEPTRPARAERAALVSVGPYLVRLLTIPGVVCSFLVFGMWGFGPFAVASVVCLTVPAAVSERWLRQHRSRAGLTKRPVAFGAVAPVMSTLGVLSAAVLAAMVADGNVPALSRTALSHDTRGHVEAAAGSLLALLVITFTAFCVLLWGRRPDAASVTRAWVSLSVWLLTVAIVFVSAGGWPVTGRTWLEGWTTFIAMALVVAAMMWQLRRVRTVPVPASVGLEGAARR
jgi:hypothetical protein